MKVGPRREATASRANDKGSRRRGEDNHGCPLAQGTLTVPQFSSHGENSASYTVAFEDLRTSHITRLDARVRHYLHASPGGGTRGNVVLEAYGKHAEEFLSDFFKAL